MSKLYDWIDWIGGYPFEVARVDEIFEFYRRRGLTMTHLTTTAGLGCNDFVFTAAPAAVPGDAARNGVHAHSVGGALT
jgi:2-polyprenyl-6-hydroxyphenyl methylase/3-demethylubiquinone-9 3-methyltransferase